MNYQRARVKGTNDCYGVEEPPAEPLACEFVHDCAYLP